MRPDPGHGPGLGVHAIELAHGAWVELLRAAPGNPLGAEVGWFSEGGEVVASRVRAQPEVQWLQHTSGPFAPAVLDEVLAWFASAGIGPRVELAPADGYEVLAARLHGAGLHQSGFSDLLRGPATAVGTDGPVEGVVVERLAGGEPHEKFGRTLLGGHEVPPDVPDAHRWAAARLPTLPTHECFLARDAATGEAMGAAMLVAREGVGYLANASTLPSSRGRGAQSALIRSRCERARELGCDTVEVVCVPWSVSNRNLRRAGFAVVHTRVQWTPPPAT